MSFCIVLSSIGRGLAMGSSHWVVEPEIRRDECIEPSCSHDHDSEAGLSQLKSRSLRIRDKEKPWSG